VTQTRQAQLFAISYEELPESEKEYDRNAATQTLKAILALGYRITKQRH
jgi:hypothetical protein